MYYQFKLPEGAMIDINGQRYRYLSNGMVANLVEAERPYIIECVKNCSPPSEKPVIENVLLEPLHPLLELDQIACRSVAFVATAEEMKSAA
jgi:hypothetical protein